MKRKAVIIICFILAVLMTGCSGKKDKKDRMEDIKEKAQQISADVDFENLNVGSRFIILVKDGEASLSVKAGKNSDAALKAWYDYLGVTPGETIEAGKTKDGQYIGKLEKDGSLTWTQIELDENEKKEDADYEEIMPAYKEFYSSFCEKNLKPYYHDSEHGDISEGDCAGKLVLDEEGFPVMAICDITSIIEGSREFLIDIYFFKYDGAEVEQYAKIPNIKCIDDGLFVDNIEGELYVYSIADKEADNLRCTVSENDYTVIPEDKYYYKLPFEFETSFGKANYYDDFELNKCIFSKRTKNSNKYCVAGGDFCDLLDYFAGLSIDNALDFKKSYDDCLLKNRVKNTAITIYYENGFHYLVLRKGKLLEYLCDALEISNDEDIEKLKKAAGIDEYTECSDGELWIIDDDYFGSDWIGFKSANRSRERAVWVIDDDDSDWTGALEDYIPSNNSLYGYTILNLNSFSEKIRGFIKSKKVLAGLESVVEWEVEPFLEVDDIQVEDSNHENAKRVSVVKNNGLWGFINYSGQYLAEPVYDTNTAGFFTYCLSDSRSGKCGGIVDGKFEEGYEYQGPLDYNAGDDPLYLSDKKLSVEKYFGMTHVLDSARVVKEGAVKNGYGLIVPLEYEGSAASYSYMENIPSYFAFEKDGKWGFCRENGEFFTGFEYDCFTEYSSTNYDNPGAAGTVPFLPTEGYIAVRKNGKNGYIDINGNEVVPCGRFDNVRPVHNGLAWVQVDGLWGVIRFKKSVSDNNNPTLTRQDYAEYNGELVKALEGYNDAWKISNTDTRKLIYLDDDIIPELVSCPNNFDGYNANGLLWYYSKSEDTVKKDDIFAHVFCYKEKTGEFVATYSRVRQGINYGTGCYGIFDFDAATELTVKKTWGWEFVYEDMDYDKNHTDTYNIDGKECTKEEYDRYKVDTSGWTEVSLECDEYYNSFSAYVGVMDLDGN